MKRKRDLAGKPRRSKFQREQESNVGGIESEQLSRRDLAGKPRRSKGQREQESKVTSEQLIRKTRASKSEFSAIKVWGVGCEL
jgi:hypothetical protein